MPLRLLTGVLLASLLLAPPALRAADDATPLWEEDPFDRIVLNADNQNAVLKVEPLPFAGRRVPPKASWAGMAPLQFQLVDRGMQQFEVAYTAIERIELFEQILLDEATKLAAAGKYDDAFSCYEALQRRSPQWPGLKEGLSRYYVASAGDAFRKGQLGEALALIDESFALEPQSMSVLGAANAVTAGLLQKYVAAKDYRSARDILARTKARYGAGLQPLVDEWTQKLAAQAEERRQAGDAALKAGKLREAHAAMREMLALWPELPMARELFVAIREQYPVLLTGVTSPWTEPNASPIWNPARRRVGRLVAPRALELTGYGPEGSEYACRIGALGRSPDNTLFTFDLRAAAGPTAAADLAATLLARTRSGDPAFYQGWNDLLAQVAVTDARHVAVKLRRPGLRPEPFLAIPLGPEPAVDKPAVDRPLTSLDRALSGGPYVYAGQGDGAARFALADGVKPATAYQPREVMERTYPRLAAALAALRRGEVDFVDRVTPRAAVGLKDATGIAVEAYALPTLHVLVPNYARPLPAHRTWRRGIEYAIDRAAIVKDLVPPDDTRAARQVSGPLPAAMSPDDPLGYGYNEQLVPRPYEPRLSVALRGAAAAELALTGDKPKDDELNKLVLVYPGTETARACAGLIARQLKLTGLVCELRELPPGRARPDDEKWDLLYGEWVVAEPYADLVEVFRPGGLVPANSPYIALALERVGQARNWNEAGERLRELHRVCQQELPVIPLWQMREHYAFRKDLRGPAPRAASPYQGLEQWRVPETTPGLVAGN